MPRFLALRWGVELWIFFFLTQVNTDRVGGNWEKVEYWILIQFCILYLGRGVWDISCWKNFYLVMIWKELAYMSTWILCPLGAVFLSRFPYWSLRIWFLFSLVKEIFINILIIYSFQKFEFVFVEWDMRKAAELYYMKFGELEDLEDY